MADLRPLRTCDPQGAEKAGGLRRSIQTCLHTGQPPVEGLVRLEPLIQSLRQALPPEGTVTLDVGVFKLVFLQYWVTDRPKSLFVANGLSAMGYALPGGLAAKLAEPDRPVVAIVGDGALHMYAGELATLARLGLPMVILVVVDQALALIRLKQLRQQVPVYGTQFGATDYASLAAAFHLDYHLIASESQAEGVLRAALAANRPALVEARLVLAEYTHFR